MQFVGGLNHHRKLSRINLSATKISAFGRCGQNTFDRQLFKRDGACEAIMTPAVGTLGYPPTRLSDNRQYFVERAVVEFMKRATLVAFYPMVSYHLKCLS